jgi:hypothetical protein
MNNLGSGPRQDTAAGEWEQATKTMEAAAAVKTLTGEQPALRSPAEQTSIS